MAALMSGVLDGKGDTAPPSDELKPEVSGYLGGILGFLPEASRQFKRLCVPRKQGGEGE